jgi:antitoxin MazE
MPLDERCIATLRDQEKRAHLCLFHTPGRFFTGGFWGFLLRWQYLPAAVARAAGLHVDQSVQITVEGSAIVIRPVNEEMNTLEQRLARFDPEKHGGEAMQSERLGAEKW